VVLSERFRRISFDDLPHWREAGHRAAFMAFRRSALYCVNRSYRSGALGIAAESFADAFAEARQAGEAPDDEATRRFFERHFVPHRVAADLASADQAGFVTGFYEPVLRASLSRTAEFTIPLHSPPADLVKLDPASVRPPGLEPSLAFARREGDRLVEYFDRREIESGALDGRGLEIAWLADPVDAFFVHVQGAARLLMDDGSVMRVTYAAKSGHPFTAIGSVLVRLGEIAPEAVTMQSIRAWLAANPGRRQEILWQNRSYIFFREAPVEDVEAGPVAAAKVPLMAGRSIAVDRSLHTFATPFFIDAPTLTAFDGRPFRRLMIAQDTGSAIVGAARGDIFAGSGDRAGEIAGIIRHQADFYAFVPRPLLRD
jgi:membrane-bound lytic murein transglycosylase A